MKNLKLIFTLFSLVLVMGAFAQDNPTGTMETTTTQKFKIEKDGKVISYDIKILEKRNYVTKFKKEDVNKMNQGRINTPAFVTKLILIDNDTDKSYDRYIVLRYKKDMNDSFDLVPTLKGFAVNVDKKHMEYIMGEGFYFVNNEDKDFFIVEEFDKF